MRISKHKQRSEKSAQVKVNGSPLRPEKCRKHSMRKWECKKSARGTQDGERQNDLSLKKEAKVSKPDSAKTTDLSSICVGADILTQWKSPNFVISRGWRRSWVYTHKRSFQVRSKSRCQIGWPRAPKQKKKSWKSFEGPFIFTSPLTPPMFGSSAVSFLIWFAS